LSEPGPEIRHSVLIEVATLMKFYVEHGIRY
jgi:hypothetical protein